MAGDHRCRIWREGRPLKDSKGKDVYTPIRRFETGEKCKNCGTVIG